MGRERQGGLPSPGRRILRARGARTREDNEDPSRGDHGSACPRRRADTAPRRGRANAIFPCVYPAPGFERCPSS
jgi:hypothetical protein